MLAVIVILAIIALIATPIILNIIENVRKESAERSVELYASAIKNAIMTEQLNGPMPTTIEEINMEDYYDGDVSCTTTDIYADGTIYLAGCTVNGTLLEDYTYGKQKELTNPDVGETTPEENEEEQKPVETAICEAVSVATPGSYTAGDKYSCKVDPNKDPYTFYVLTTADSSATNVNMIMAQNINAAGEAVDGTQTQGNGLVAWNSSGSNTSGPVDAMNYLAGATKDWTNLGSKQTISSFDDDAGNTHTMTGIESYARLPYKSEVSSYVSGTNDYLYEYLDTGGGVATNGVSGVYGYWTLSSFSSYSNYAWGVNYYGDVYYGNDVYGDDDFGVRPVIEVLKSKLA